MENRCDSVDALMYAYYAFMKSKEENRMLKKNENYVEFTLQYTSVDWARSKDCPEVCLKGYSDFSFPGVPIMDVVCNEFDHKVVVVSKRDFEKLQARADSNAELAKEWEKNYNLLLNKTGFDTVEELVFYLTNVVQCDTLQEAIASLQDKLKYTCDKWNDMKKKLEECEKDYISERDKAEAVQTENEQLKQKLHEFDPIPEFKELLKKLNSTEDVEELKWVLNHTCGGRGSVNGWIAVSLFWKQNCEAFSKLVGFSSVEEIQDYLTNEAECDTLHEAISKLKDQVKYTCDEWYSANSRNNSWKAAAECNSPKELIEKLNLLRDDISGRSTVIESYKRDIEKWQKATGCLRPEDISTESLTSKCTTLEQEVKILNGALQEWKEGTGCPSPSAAENLIESGMSYEYAYHEAQKENRKLTEEVDSWKNVTGYSTPEDYMHARISGAFHTPFDYTAAWQKATGCDTPEAAKCRINNLIGEAEAWESDYNHLLALTGFDNEGEIEDFLEQNNDRNKLTTVIDNIKLENEAMKTALRASNLAMQKELENNIDEWQKATGCETPDKARSSIADMMNGKETTIYLGDTHNVIARWQKVTGFNEPKHFLKWKADIEGILEAWKDDTGCDTPNDAKKRIEALNERIDESEACYNNLLKFTGYKSEQDIRVLLNNSEQFVYKDMRELINSLKRKAKFTESNWQGVTGFSTPEKCSSYIDRLEKKLEDIKNLTEED